MAPPPDDAGPPPQAQRTWRSVCPQCGAPFDFASPASASAVCGFCRSTLLREGGALRRIGQSAELFEDHSPLQLGARGRHQGQAFTLVGRLQLRWEGGTWNEWHALFDRGAGRLQSAWLSEDNGAYVLAFDQPTPQPVPAFEALTPGLRRQVGLAVWSVASVQTVEVVAAQGELPRPPPIGRSYTVADLRNAGGEVGTLDDADPAQVQWSVGRSVTLAALAMTGLREGPSEAETPGRSLPCPHCGHPLAPTLQSTRSLSCPQCQSVVDISGGVGAELAHYVQRNGLHGGADTALPLGRTGVLDADGDGQVEPWQLVGLLERCELPGGADDDGEGAEQVFWREYLLYHRTRGFAFLVDAEDGWSVVRPLTGAPDGRGATVRWDGKVFVPQARYRARTTWVQGEFYWRVAQGETVHVTDHRGPDGWVLSREEVPGEVTWSLGRRLPVAALAKAFRLDAAERARLLRPDAGPLAGLVRTGGGLDGVMAAVVKFVLLAVLILLVFTLVARCTQDDCDGVRQAYGAESPELRACQQRQSLGRSSGSGGSWGGFSSGGGGHK